MPSIYKIIQNNNQKGLATDVDTFIAANPGWTVLGGATFDRYWNQVVVDSSALPGPPAPAGLSLEATQLLILAQLDVALSTRASELTLLAVLNAIGGSSTNDQRNISRGTTALNTSNNTSLYCLIAIALKVGSVGKELKFKDAPIICTSTCAFQVYLIKNPTVVGVALSFTNLVDSDARYDASRLNTTTIIGGTILWGGLLNQTNEGNLSANLKGIVATSDTDIYVLAVQRLTGNAETFYASINWEETP